VKNRIILQYFFVFVCILKTFDNIMGRSCKDCTEFYGLVRKSSVSCKNKYLKETEQLTTSPHIEVVNLYISVCKEKYCTNEDTSQMCHFAWYFNWRSVHESERNIQIIKTEMGSFKNGHADVENVSLLLLLVTLSVTRCKKTLCFQGQIIVLFICSPVALMFWGVFPQQRS